VIYEAEQQQSSLAKHKERFAARDVQPMFERELLLWHGGKVWFELSNSFLEIKGQPTHLLSIFRDITERKIAEEKMHDFAGRLERSNRELQDFAYVASHDLQEPLRKVAVFSDRLKVKHGAALGAEGIDYVERMQKATARMQTLITDLLSFSRVTSKSQPFIPIDLHKVVTEVMADLEARIEQVGGKVEVGALPTIEAEPLQMRQLFQNLIGNALKFNRPNEKPLVRIEGKSFRDRMRWREIDGTAREMVQLTVSDNGIGFDEKYVEKIFQVFQRLHGREAYEGTGMGLAITRKIAEHHGGEITAKSKPGEGATFIVTLPAKQRKTKE
jgi:light-regulated signal transduction histidine kinase (bacteriophytochrome)